MDAEVKTMEITQTQDVLAPAVQKAAQGDHDAFREIFEAGSDKVFRYLLGQLHNREEALDLLQETFIDIWRALPTFHYRSNEEFWGFVFTIARRKVFAFRKHAVRAGEITVDQECLERLSDERTDATLEYQGEQHFLPLLLEKLSSTSREILKLRYWSELSFKEIALTIQTSENAAKVRHHRALKELQTHFPKDYVEQQFI